MILTEAGKAFSFVTEPNTWGIGINPRTKHRPQEVDTSWVELADR